MLSCVQVAALRRTGPPFKESYELCKDQETEKGAEVQQRALEPSIDNNESSKINMLHER
jgi:hypothetical protein